MQYEKPASLVAAEILFVTKNALTNAAVAREDDDADDV